MAAKTHKDFLLFLTRLSLKQLKSLATHFTASQKKGIREIAVNLLNNNLNITAEDKKLLFPYRRFIRQIARKSIKKCLLSRFCRGLMVLLNVAKNTLLNL